MTVQQKRNLLIPLGTVLASVLFSVIISSTTTSATVAERSATNKEAIEKKANITDCDALKLLILDLKEQQDKDKQSIDNKLDDLIRQNNQIYMEIGILKGKTDKK